jgi:hypothetical protein
MYSGTHIGRQPQFVGKWKIFFGKIEDHLNYFQNGRQPHLFIKMEDDPSSVLK